SDSMNAATQRLRRLTVGGHGIVASMNDMMARAAKPYCLYVLPDFSDDAVWARALELKDKYANLDDTQRRLAIWQEIRERIFVAVGEHEVGHSVGFEHNFQGSWDAINFRPKFWDLRKQNLMNPQRNSDYFAQMEITNEQQNGGMRLLQYSSI